MKQYPVDKLRNVVLLGHGGDGKTSLAEQVLFYTKAIDRLGKISDGNTVSDYDPEEIKRAISTSLSIVPTEQEGFKINIIDTPGYFDFVGEVIQGVRVADAAVIVLAAKSGVEVGTKKAYDIASKNNLPKMIFVNKIDEENADFYKTLDELREVFGVKVCPIIIPIIEGEKITGIVDCVRMTARKLNGNTVVDAQVPADMNDRIEPIRNMLMESVAETSEELMEKYFSGEEFSADEIDSALKTGVKNGDIIPVLCGSGYTGIGVPTLLKSIISYFPAPNEKGAEKALDLNDNEIEIKISKDDPTSAIIFKTVADPFVGKMSYFKVISGSLKANSELLNSVSGVTEKIGRIFFVRGKKQVETTEVTLGDIGAVTKLLKTNTGDTLCAPSRPVKLKGLEFPRPCLSLAIVPKQKGDEEKISSGLNKLMEEDKTFIIYNNPETRQLIISGTGDVHLDVILSKLKSKFGAVAELIEPRVPYRETIRKPIKVEGKHKKQSGGHGQYGHVWIEFEPGDQEDLIFEEKVFGGAVPRNFFPAVEKGLRDSIKRGVLAGYPVVNLKATLVDGSYHPVDSSEMAFKMAASLAYKAGLVKASPVLLEPIGKLEVHIPEENMGDIIGDINKRRGQILGMNKDDEGMSVVEAYVPLSEMHTYAIELRSMTRGQGYFALDFDRYEQAPENVAQKVIADAKAEMESEE